MRIISRVLTSLRSQILAFTTVLLTVSLGAVLLVVLYNSNAAIRESVNEDMDRAVNGLRSSMESTQTQLINSARVLVSDFGFKQAVASGDRKTVASMLANHGDRLDADLMFILNLDGTVLSTTNHDMPAGSPFPYGEVTQTVRRGNLQADFFVFGESIYEVVLVPVRTPRISAIAGVGLKITRDQIRRMLPDLRVHIIFTNGIPGQTLANNDEWVVVSTLDSLGDVVEAIRSPETFSSAFRVPFFGEYQKYSSRFVDIGETDSSDVQIILADSLDSFYSGYDSIRNKILIIAISIIALAIAGSFAIAHGLTVPLKVLAKASEDIAEGRYTRLTNMSISSIEISTLVTAFKRMKKDLAEREERIRYQASHDSLTGLLNRDAMIEAVGVRTEEKTPFILLGINLVGFKTINDSLGVEIGDQCLQTIAERLKNIASNGVAARHSADEFSVVLESPEEVEKNSLMLLCTRVINKLSAPMQLDGVSVSVDCRAGFIHFPTQAEDAGLLIRRGNIAMEHAITTNTSLYFYQEGQDKVHLKKIKILKHLKETLQNDDGQLQMYYQPKLNLRTGKIEKAEALIRWFHPDEGFIPPDMFIELAEQTGLIGLVTNWVISRVLDDMVKMKANGVTLQVSINLSAQDLSNEGLRNLIEHKLTDNRLNASEVCLEVTERDMMTDVGKSLELLNYYRDRGFQLSVDDYGVGYSALAKLAELPVHELKIDKCFILKLASQKDDQIIVRSTVSMAHELGLSVVAEGVEDLESQQWLADVGCDFIQGYYLARPMSLDAVIDWVDEYRSEKPTE